MVSHSQTKQPWEMRLYYGLKANIKKHLQEIWKFIPHLISTIYENIAFGCAHMNLI